jgi:dihydroorotate dehydrogenase (fumarate)
MTEPSTRWATRWLGLDLRSPLVVGASPLADDVELARELVHAGAGAVVMRSLFEEQLVAEEMALHRYFDHHVDTDAEARSFLPATNGQAFGSDPYLAQLRRLRDALDVPVIASLNGTSPGGWTRHAAELEEAGASAVELNLYEVATRLDETGQDVEDREIEVVQAVVDALDIPVSVKLTPFYASVPSFVSRLARTGVAGVVMFNRFYQPDIDLETLDVDRTLVLSTPAELPIRLHALALLHGRLGISLASSGGVHRGTDAAKAILCGADAVQIVSALLPDPVTNLTRISGELTEWLDQQGYRDLEEARGATSFGNVADPAAWERLNYSRILQGWRPR